MRDTSISDSAVFCRLLQQHALRDIIFNQEKNRFNGVFRDPVQDWYKGKRMMPEYLLRLMIYKAEIEKIVSHDI